MKEKIVHTQLTEQAASSTLDRRSIMAEPGQNEQPPRNTRREASSVAQTPVINGPEASMSELMAARNPQGAREVAAALHASIAAQGREPTQRELEFIRGTGFIPPGEGGQDMSISQDWDPKLKNFMARINLKLADPALRGKYNPISDLMSLYEVADVDPAQVEQAAEQLRTYLKATRDEDSGAFERFRSLSLQKSDTEILQKSSMSWLDEQFDLLYRVAKSGELLDSPQAQAIQQKFNEAYGFLQDLQRQGEPVTDEELMEFQSTYNIRFSLIFASASIDRRNLEGIQGAVQRLGSHGFAVGMSLDNGRVGAMYNRILQMGNDLRVREGGIVKDKNGNEKYEKQHFSPEIVAKLKSGLISEQIKLATEKQTGSFYESYKELLAANNENQDIAKRLLKQEVVRAISTAEDLYKVSQQMAINAARGKVDTNHMYQYFSDPKSFFDLFNMEAFSIEKWGLLNHHQQEFFRRIKLDLAKYNSKGIDTKGFSEEQLEELGTRLLRDLFAVPDFFSSGWRIKGITEQIDNLQLYYAQNEDLAKDMVKGVADPTKIRFQNAGNDALVQTKVDEGLRASSAQASQEQNEKHFETDAEKEHFFAQRRKELILQFLEKDLTYEERQLYLSKFGSDAREKQKKAATGNASQLALFMRLKSVGGDRLSPDKDESIKTVDAWTKIQKYRADDIVRLVRERKGLVGDFDELNRIDAIFKSPEIGILDDTYYNEIGDKVTVRAHDVFRRDYMPILSHIREQALRGVPPQAVDFRRLNPQQTEMVNAVFRKNDNDTTDYAAQIKLIYQKMDEYIHNNEIINKLIKNSEYEDLYTRVQVVDDVIMDKLELMPENSGFQQVSDQWSSERGADALVRNYNDLGNGQKAGGALIGFLLSEKQEDYLKHATEFAEATGQYNGRGGMAQSFRYTFGTYLTVAQQDYLLDLAGVGKLPFRWKSSDIERIYGPAANPQTREELRKTLDHISGFLVTDNANKEDAEKLYTQLEHLLGVNASAMARDKLFTGLMYALLLLLLIPPAATLKATAEASK